MVDNNIVIKINDKLVDYDDDTVVAITYSAFNPSEIDKILLSGTNEFTLPITPNNKKIFNYIENTSSNNNDVYDKSSCYIFLAGAKIFTGECYVNEVNERYNVQFIEGKNVFDKLKELPFVRLHSDEYPVSLVSKLAYKWNTEYLPEIERTYSPSTSEDYLTAVVNYLSQNENGNPKNNYCLPVVKNIFAEKCYRYNNDYEIDAYDNNLYYNTDGHDDLGRGFVIGKNFGFGDLKKYNAWSTYYVSGKTAEITTNPRYGITLISPIWVRVSYIISLLEEHTGYTFENISDIIERYNNDNILYMHIPALEFETSFDVRWYDIGISNRWSNSKIEFAGKLQCLKGNKDWYGYKFDNGSIDNIYDADIQSDLTCLDLLKTLMQEYCLTCYVDNKDKKITFTSFSDLRLTGADKLNLNEEKTKKFSIENIKQKQLISYTEIADGTTAGSLLIECSNKNIDEGGEDSKMMEIERYLWKGSDYNYRLNSKPAHSMNICTIDNDANTKSFSFGYPICHTTPTSTGYLPFSEEIHQVSLSLTYRFAGKWYGSTGAETSEPEDWDDSSKHCEVAIYTPLEAGTFINKVYQSSVRDNGAYEYYQSMIDKPVYEEVVVKKDIKYLLNWKTLSKVKITGLTGTWYVKEIYKFNPRTDETMTLKVIKLPTDFTSYYTLTLNVSPADGGTVTGAGIYAADSSVVVTATANSGYWFQKWNDGTLNSTRTVYMDGNKNYTAQFGFAPEGFARVEWIQSDGQQYIDTGIYTNDYGVRCKVQLASGAMAFGGDWNSEKQGSTLYKSYAYYKQENTAVSIKNIGEAAYSDISFNRNVIVIDTEPKIITPSAGTTAQMDNSLKLFRTGNEGWLNPVRFKDNIVIFEGSTQNVILSLMPVIRLSDSKPGYYDARSKHFFTNAGTGEFTFGPIMLAEHEISELEYVGTNGSSYFDLTYDSNEYSKSEITAMGNSSTSGSFGQADSTGRFGFAFNYNGQMTCYVNNSYYTGTGIYNAEYVKKTITMDFINRTLSNGTSVYAFPTITMVPQSTKYCIGSLLINNGHTENFNGRIYTVRLWNNSILTYDMVAASFGTFTGMYDKIGHKLYTSESGTNFTSGPLK